LAVEREAVEEPGLEEAVLVAGPAVAAVVLVALGPVEVEVKSARPENG
jgi:hypothetical protein